MHIHDIFRAQHGLATRRQVLVEARVSRSQISRLLKNGDWLSVHRGVYRHSATPPSWESRLLAAALSSGGIASHRCAAALWQLDGFNQPPIELTIPESSWRGLPGFRIHRSTQWDRRDATDISGIPVTGINRTILDCAGVLGYHRTERVAEAAIRKKLTSWLELIEVLRTHSRQGRNGCFTLRTLLDHRLGDQTVPLSEFSRLVSSLLVDAGLPKPTLEYRIVDDIGRHVLQADLAWPALKKAWELDGLEWHFGRDDVERDRRKRNRAKSLGWNIQEILWSMYADEPRQLVEMARLFLRNS